MENKGEHDTKTTLIGVVLTAIGACSLPICLAQLIIGGTYVNQCPANQMIPTFNIVSGVLGLVAAVLSLTAGVLHLRKQAGKTIAIVGLIAACIIHAFFIPWYMYGGTLTSVDKSAKLRQSTNSSDSSTYCVSNLQQVTDGVVLLYWMSIVIAIICLAVHALVKR